MGPQSRATSTPQEQCRARALHAHVSGPQVLVYEALKLLAYQALKGTVERGLRMLMLAGLSIALVACLTAPAAAP